MFSELINLENLDENEIIELLYKFFYNDFVKNKTYLADTIFIDPKSSQKTDNKEDIFWHIITRKDRRNRVLDKQRASRIKWVKIIIQNFNNEHIKMFYYYEDSRKIRLYLWAYKFDFVVILQKLGNTSSYLVTSFYIDNQRKKDIFEKKYNNYINKIDERLNNCEWF